MQKQTPCLLVLNETLAPAKQESILRTIICNLLPEIRHEEMEGRDYLVVPMVMMTEGVHNGSEGPLYYSAQELAKIPGVWNMKPITVYHPMINGQGVSACDPDIITAQKIGVIMNAKWDGRLSAEAWLEEDRVRAVDERIMTALENKEMVEISTGLFTDTEYTTGVWNGEDYVAKATNFRPDHLAILPDKKGACSIADGAGLLRNEASFDSVRTLLHTALREAFPDFGPWVEDVFKDFFIYESDRKFWHQQYTNTDTEAVLVGEPVQVARVVQYRSLDGSVTHNVVGKEIGVNKKQKVDGLITNAASVWQEDDRSYLMSMTDDRIKKLVEVTYTKEPTANGTEEETPKTPVVGNETQETTTETPKGPTTLAEWIESAPTPEIKDMLAAGLRTHAAQKQKLIQVITANDRNVFTDAQLKSKKLDELQAIATLAAAPVTGSPTFAGLADVLGSGGTAMTANQQEALPLPGMDFSGKE